MKIVCASCGKVSEIAGCRFCGSQVCSQCVLEYGCRMCKGRKSVA